MSLDLVAWALKLINQLGPYKDKLQKSWPVVLHMTDDLKQLLTIWNDGKALMFDGPPSTTRGQQLVLDAVAAGISEEEATQVALIFETASLRIPEDVTDNGAVDTGAGNAIPHKHTQMQQQSEARSRQQPRRFQ